MPSMTEHINAYKRFSHSFRKVLDRLRNISYYDGKTDISNFRCEGLTDKMTWDRTPVALVLDIRQSSSCFYGIYKRNNKFVTYMTYVNQNNIIKFILA